MAFAVVASRLVSLTIAAPAERVYAALRNADLGAGVLTLLLFGPRALPGAIQSGRLPRRPTAIRLAELERFGFTVLAERPHAELLIGLQGRFWTLRGNLEVLDQASAAAPIPAGRARAGWNFTLAPGPHGGTVLATETRVRCANAGARRRFRGYWALIRPGSGLIR